MTNFAGDWKNFILDRYLWFHVHLKKKMFFRSSYMIDLHRKALKTKAKFPLICPNEREH